MKETYVKEIESALCFLSDISGHDIYCIDFTDEAMHLPVCITHNNCQTCHSVHDLFNIALSMFSKNKSSIYLCPGDCYHILVPIVYENTVKGAIISEPLLLHSQSTSDENMPLIHADRLCKTAQILRFSMHCPAPKLCQKESHLKSKLTQAISENNPVLAEELLNYCFEDMITECGMEMTSLKNQSLALLLLLDELSMHHATYQTTPCAQSAFDLWLFADSIGLLKHSIDMAVRHFLNTVFCPLSQKHASLVHKAVEYMHIHYAEKITQSQIASLVYLSSSYFSKVFKDTMGCSFNEYLNRIRIEKARKLLECKEFEIDRISDMVGFENRSYFGKVFKQFTSTTPKQYRNNQ